MAIRTIWSLDIFCNTIVSACNLSKTIYYSFILWIFVVVATVVYSNVLHGKFVRCRLHLSCDAFPYCCRHLLPRRVDGNCLDAIRSHWVSLAEEWQRRGSLCHFTTEQDGDRGRIKSSVCGAVQANLWTNNLPECQLLDERKTLRTVRLSALFICCTTGLRQLPGNCKQVLEFPKPYAQ